MFEGRLADERVEESWKLDFDGLVGAAVPGIGGSILVATHNRLVVVTPSGDRLEGPKIVADGQASRANDGKCDPAGRFVVGTMALDDREGSDRLLRVEDDGSLSTLDSDLTLSNGLGWSPDGSTFYNTDSIQGVIWSRDYDVDTGATGVRREFLRFEDGLPDGLCVDSRGHLWVAIWGAGEVRSFAPDGAQVATVKVAAPHTSSVAFVGDSLDTLLITTASRDLGEAERRRYPDAGRLFLADVRATGTPVFPCSESWLDSAQRGA